jgi:NAD(P)-dependent dehydrogenase (short-subunit alcohol dehydrogenase family)
MGRAIALRAAQEGAKLVVVADLKRDPGEAVAAEIEKAGSRAIFYEVDLRSADGIRQMVEEAFQLGGSLDVLVNNAAVTDDAVAGHALTIETLPEDVWDNVMAVNAKAMWLATKFAAPYLKRSKLHPAIVNGASVASSLAYRGLPSYSVSKGAVAQLTRMTAIDLAPFGIRCNAYAPGTINTPMLEQSYKIGADPQKIAQACGGNLIKRFGNPDEVARLVCFLASDESSFTTGSIYQIDGGAFAWRGHD